MTLDDKKAYRCWTALIIPWKNFPKLLCLCLDGWFWTPGNSASLICKWLCFEWGYYDSVRLSLVLSRYPAIKLTGPSCYLWFLSTTFKLFEERLSARIKFLKTFSSLCPLWVMLPIQSRRARKRVKTQASQGTLTATDDEEDRTSSAHPRKRRKGSQKQRTTSEASNTKFGAEDLPLSGAEHFSKERLVICCKNFLKNRKKVIFLVASNPQSSDGSHRLVRNCRACDS